VTEAPVVEPMLTDPRWSSPPPHFFATATLPPEGILAAIRDVAATAALLYNRDARRHRVDVSSALLDRPAAVNLHLLFHHPHRFFLEHLRGEATPQVALITWCYGAAHIFDRVDRELLRADLGHPRPGWKLLGPIVEGDWVGMWAFVIGVSMVTSVLTYYIGGWWYRVRARWSDAEELDPAIVRRVFVYASFVHNAPTILVAAIWTLLYDSYGAAWAADDPLSYVVMVAPLWSLYASYAGVRTLLRVNKTKAMLWFVYFPAAGYLMGIATTMGITEYVRNL